VPIDAGMNVTEDRAYLQRLLMCKGVHAPDDLLRAGGGASRARPTATPSGTSTS
jgi:hypothetical protein